MKLAIAQINTIVGDLEGNTKKIISYIEKARKKKADIVVFPEMAITGYPTQDLLFKTKFLKENKKKLRKIVSATKDITAIVGFVDYDEKDPNKRYNSAAIIRDKKMLFTQNKLVLPNYDVFVEPRYFKPGKKQRLFSLNGKKIGVLICEDLWVNEPAIGLKKLGADVMITISCSPFHVGKIGIRRRLLEARAKQTKAAQVYVNLVGGQDDLIFDGRCLVTNEKGEFLHKCPRFEESLAVVDLDKEPDFKWPKVDLVKETYGA